MHLETERLLLRPFREDDLVDLVAQANDLRIWRQLRDRFPFPYTEEHGRRWISFSAEAPRLAALAVTLGDRVIGGIGLERLDDVTRFTAELGYWLGVEHWGRGYAVEAIGALVAHAFESTDLERIEAWVFATNAASSRALEKCGFRLEGTCRRGVFKDGEFRDSRLYARLRGGADSDLG